MKKIFILTACCALIMSSVCLAQNAQNMQSAREAVNSMTIGWNLGNTLDATGKRGKQCVTPQDWETSWDQPV
nr:hypothetical protein [Bacteroidales bacterium]